MKHSSLFIILVLVSWSSIAQDYSSTSKKAIKRFEEARACYQAFNNVCSEERLLKALKADETFVEAYQMIAQICFDQGRIDESIGYFARTLELDPDGNPDGYRLLAGLTILKGDYTRALALIDTFLAFPPERVKMREQGVALRENCHFAMDAIKHPVPFQPENLGEAVNSGYSEYWPSLSVDEQVLIFTVMLPVGQTGGDQSQGFQEDFYYSLRDGSRWEVRKNAGPPLNTPDNEGAHSMTADGKTLFFTACNRIDGLGMCDIYQSALENGKWTLPRNIGIPVNSGYSEKHPTISADGRSLYFTSNRPGGLGSFDIWKSVKNGDTWSKPVNLGDSVNTPGLEQSPFIHPDQRSLYFSSTGWPGMGQGDLFMVRRDFGLKWSEPVNLGYPINTYNDEIGLSVNAAGDRAYFASDRLSGTDTDLYTFELPSEVRPTPVSYMKGRVFDSRNMKGLRAVLQLIDLETEETVMEIESKAGEGDYLISLPSGRDYALNVSADGYLFHSDHFTFSGLHKRHDPLRRDISLDRVQVGNSVVLNNIFFETNSHQLLPDSKAELNKLYGFLLLNPNIVVEIAGHTDSTGSSEYNQKLSEERAQAVVDFLYDKGIRIRMMKPAGYGDTVPVGENSTAEGRALNRRTELKITQILSNTPE